mmetsp:Transcript_17705/g.42058  ORF Transcript_17705/g.42058 Transcript_17705/m.42058 type:complete len:338 (-) Transcript_17705:315-1328(-)
MQGIGSNWAPLLACCTHVPVTFCCQKRPNPLPALTLLLCLGGRLPRFLLHLLELPLLLGLAPLFLTPLGDQPGLFLSTPSRGIQLFLQAPLLLQPDRHLLCLHLQTALIFNAPLPSFDLLLQLPPALRFHLRTPALSEQGVFQAPPGLDLARDHIPMGAKLCLDVLQVRVGQCQCSLILQFIRLFDCQRIIHDDIARRGSFLVVHVKGLESEVCGHCAASRIRLTGREGLFNNILVRHKECFFHVLSLHLLFGHLVTFVSHQRGVHGSWICDRRDRAWRVAVDSAAVAPAHVLALAAEELRQGSAGAALRLGIVIKKQLLLLRLHISKLRSRSSFRR